jgi:UrcA family protein
MKRTLALFLLFSITACAAPSQSPAENIERVASISVPLGDLDLRNPADRAQLLERLRRAAFHACGGWPRFHPSYELMPRHTTEVFKQCRRDALARAVNAIGSPELTRAFYSSSESSS